MEMKQIGTYHFWVWKEFPEIKGNAKKELNIGAVPAVSWSIWCVQELVMDWYVVNKKIAKYY